ncbi:hypothetical protein [Nocardioides sp. GXQ0305]|uniref:hypothetical protein n=1 Tax=Nocardioides sp. GXQ0305 TaxID=3423912 RepID=UPI003D7CDADE
MTPSPDLPTTAGVDLYWLPLGAGDTTGCVRTNGKIYEAVVSRLERRPARDLFHAALQVTVGSTRCTIEMAPAWAGAVPEDGVVREGPVGLRVLGRSRLFRYQVRCWRGGEIPDAAAAVGGPRRVSSDPWQARQLLAAIAAFPSATWGRDELHAGEMWNSNSLVAWLLARSGHDMDHISPPATGRAPGWRAGVVVAERRPVAPALPDPQSRDPDAGRAGR